MATFNKEKEVNEALLIKDPSLLWEAKIIGNSSERAKPRGKRALSWQALGIPSSLPDSTPLEIEKHENKVVCRLPVLAETTDFTLEEVYICVCRR